MWEPIALKELNDLISKGELELDDEQLNFWNLIKIEPEKWDEKDYGNEGNGFWVVAIFGHSVIWYNDIEEGFNISEYKYFGIIEAYECSQDELNWTIVALMNRIKTKKH